MSRIRNLQWSIALSLCLSLGAVSSTTADDDHGHGKGHKGGGGGHGWNGGGNQSQNFFGFGPEGFTYGYRNDNFGLLIGPVGGGGYYPAPVYEPAYVGPPAVYADPGVYGGGNVYQPPSSAPAMGPSYAAPSNIASGNPTPVASNSAYRNPGSSAETFYRQSVEAFRAGDYQKASKLADHAIVEDTGSGTLRIYASQCLLANGEFDAAGAALADGLALVDPSQWGEEVKNFRTVYQRNDYVTHIKQLESFAKENPKDPIPNALLTYHFYYLGHSDAALRHWKEAREADPNDRLVQLLAGVTKGAPTEELPQPRSILQPSN